MINDNNNNIYYFYIILHTDIKHKSYMCACVHACMRLTICVRIPNKINCRNAYTITYTYMGTPAAAVVAPRSLCLCERTTEACAHQNTVAVW